MMRVEVRVAVEDVPLGGMKQGENGDAKVLFVRDDAGIRAFQSKCPHYGAPLAKGEICGSTLYCPWHKAAFSIADGALREPPALEGLDRYPVRIEGVEAVATLTPMEDAPGKSDFHTDNTEDGDHVVIVGVGAAAVTAVTTLRLEGFAGRITMIGQEAGAPYDRPKLSKNFLAKKTAPEAMVLQKDFYAAHDVDFVQGVATAIDSHTRAVTVDGRTVVGDMLLVATGSTAVLPPFPGRDRQNVFTLRSLGDAKALSDAADGAKTVVVVGGGFIGLEAAAFLTKRGLQATVVSPEALPLANRFGTDVAAAIKAFHETNGVRFLQGKVATIDGDAKVSGLTLEDGTRLPADIVLVGAGAKPETGPIKGVTLREDGGIETAADLSIAPNVWLAGDIAAFPDHRSGACARIEHWRLAEQHGAHVARAMLGRREPFSAAPFFWSNQGEKRLDYVGHAPTWDRIITRGTPAALDFISFYVKDEKALAACAIGYNPQVIAFLHLLDEDRVPPVSDLATADLTAFV